MSKQQDNNSQYIIPAPSYNSINVNQCSNLKLLLDKYVKFYNPKGDKKISFFSEINKAKSEVYKNFKNSINKNREAIEQLLNIINTRQKNISDYSFKLKTKSRLIVGLGSGSVLEVSIKLHHIYGIPYIPSSAIKGVLRAFKLLEFVDWNKYKFSMISEIVENYSFNNFEKLKDKVIKNLNEDNELKKKYIKEDVEKDELVSIKADLLKFVEDLKEEKIKDIVNIFGNQQQKGNFIILDAYPEKLPSFEKDIMNVHYPNYYAGEEPPTDNQNPNPIIFLTIKKETNFNFYFKNSEIYKKIFEKDIKEDLKNAFETIGIGAKTALGYGILE